MKALGSRRSDLRMALLTTAGALVVAATPMQGWGRIALAREQQQPAPSHTLFVPMALIGPLPAGGQPMASPTLAPITETPMASPMPSPASKTPTPAAEARQVLFQIATYGGLSFDLQLSYMPSMTPWFTLFEDGTYIRIVEHRGIGPDGTFAVERFAGRLEDQALAAFQKTLVDEVQFFDLPGTPPPMICITDHPYDRVHFASGQRQHSLVVYGLSMYASGEYRCPTPPDHRLVLLADLVAKLRDPMSPSERTYDVERGTLVAVEARPWPTDFPHWPIPDIRLADLSGESKALALQGSKAQAVADAVVDHAYVGTNVAYFLEGEKLWLVGFRLEFDGWDAYSPTFFP